MSQVYNVEINRYNGTDYDTLYPKTHIDNVDGINGAVSNIMQTNLKSFRALQSDSNGKIIASGVTNEELSQLSGVTANIQTQLNNKAAASVSSSGRLTAANWANKIQTVTVVGVKPSSNIVVTSAPLSYIAYAEAGVRCTGQGNDALTFQCEETPTQNLVFNVLIIG